MPELPEGETIRRIIEPQISGRSITSLEIHNPQIIAFPDTDTFSSSLVGCSFTGMSRRGKFLIFHLDTQIASLQEQEQTALSSGQCWTMCVRTSRLQRHRASTRDGSLSPPTGRGSGSSMGNGSRRTSRAGTLCGEWMCRLIPFTAVYVSMNSIMVSPSRP